MALTNLKYNALPQRANIQGFWRMEETSGTRSDESDNSNDLTDNNTVGYATGKIGNAADFESSNTECLTIADASQTGLDITGEITIAAWIKLESNDTEMAIVCKLHSSGTYAYLLNVNSSNGIRFLLSSDGSDATAVNSDTAMNTATWYHVIATLNQADDKMRLYHNGSLDCTPISYTSNIYNSGEEFAIGARSNSHSYPFDGLIDEVIVWNTCLTASEISDVYSITNEYLYKKSGFQLWWGFCESWQRHDKLWRNNRLHLPKDLGFSY